MDNKILKSSWAIAFTVASIWFGTHVGGGFASGNQVVGYFSQFGSLGSLLFPIISMGLLAFVMSIYLKFARLNGFDNYRDTFAALYPSPKMEFLFEIFYIIIILGSVSEPEDGVPVRDLLHHHHPGRCRRRRRRRRQRHRQLPRDLLCRRREDPAEPSGHRDPRFAEHLRRQARRRGLHGPVRGHHDHHRSHRDLRHREGRHDQQSSD